MYCSKCGKEVNNNNKFCNHCGTEIATQTNQTDECSANKISNSKFIVNRSVNVDIVYIIILMIIIFGLLWGVQITMNMESHNILILLFQVLLIVVCLFEIYPFICNFKRLLNNTDFAIIDTKGIIDNGSYASLGTTIYWEDIEKIYIKGLYGVHIKIKNESKYLNNASSIKRLFISINKKSGFETVSINLIGTGITPEQFTAQADKYYKLYKESQQKEQEKENVL